MVLIDQFHTRNNGFFILTAQVDVNLTAGTAGTGIAHFPEVVMGIAIDDVILRQVSFPELGSLIITADANAVVTLKHRSIQVLWIELIYINEQVPSPVDSLVLEVITK